MPEAEHLIAALRLADPSAPADKRTICEVLRELGRDAEQRGDMASLRRILEATLMAKRMQRALTERGADVDART